MNAKATPKGGRPLGAIRTLAAVRHLSPAGPPESRSRERPAAQRQTDRADRQEHRGVRLHVRFSNSVSLARLISAASAVLPPRSGWCFLISARCALTISRVPAALARPSTS